MNPLILHVGTDFLHSLRWPHYDVWGKPKFPIVWIKNRVDTNKFHFSKEARNRICKQLDIGEDVIVIGTIGNLSHQKNPHYLIRILEHLKKQSYNIYKLLFIG